MKFDNQLRYGSTIIGSYQGGVPLHAWLKNFFREHKQMGSKDRRVVSDMVYGFYRMGHALREMPTEDRMLVGLFLCYETPDELLQYFRPEWNARRTLPLPEKIDVLRHSGIGFEPADIFPWRDELSESIDHGAFCLSFLRPPDLFLRIRPGYEKTVLSKMAALVANPGSEKVLPGIENTFIPPWTLRLPNGFKVADWFAPDKEVVIQDYSSQKIAAFLEIDRQSLDSRLDNRLYFWDACAASGGKSILAFDLNPGIDITVSDIRESILHNLRERFHRAGITNYRAYLVDLAKGPDIEITFRGPQTTKVSSGFRPHFDLVLADVPCSGSGTWSRTPEELYFFHPDKILHYSAMQKKIVVNLHSRLAKGGHFVYSTCSVFKKENEEIVAFIQESFGSLPDRIENIKGYDMKADSMFAARFAG